jgi:hypothetical protein
MLIEKVTTAPVLAYPDLEQPFVTSSYTHASESYVLIGHESALFHVSQVLPRSSLTRPLVPSIPTSWLTHVLLFFVSCGTFPCSV